MHETASMPPLCALVGALLVSYPLEHFGRKKTLIGITTPFMLGFLLMGLTHFGHHKAMLYVGRLMTGLVNGGLTPSSQIYVCNFNIFDEPFVMKISLSFYVDK